MWWWSLDREWMLKYRESSSSIIGNENSKSMHSSPQPAVHSPQKCSYSAGWSSTS